MGDFDSLVGEAEAAPVEGWDFGWLDGRATEERPTWHYFERVVERVAGVASLLDVEAGVGSMIGTLPSLPSLAVATEGFAPNVVIAAQRLRTRHVPLVATSQACTGLPFATDSFDLVISRHPIEPWWDEIARVLKPGGSYLAQHVGPHSLRSLSEFMMGSLRGSEKRDPAVERSAAEAAGLVVHSMRVERPRTAFFDIGAVVYFLRLVPWIVPGFSVDRYRAQLHDLHEVIVRKGSFETTAARVLVDATKPGPQ